VGLPGRVHELDPAALRDRLASGFEQALCPREPAARDCEVAEDVQLQPREDASRPGGGERVAFFAVGGEAALVRFDRALVVALQVEGTGEALEEVRSLTFGERGLIRLSGGLRLASLEGVTADGGQGLAGLGCHGSIIA
jgi:hypothetical protein